MGRMRTVYGIGFEGSDFDAADDLSDLSRCKAIANPAARHEIISLRTTRTSRL